MLWLGYTAVLVLLAAQTSYSYENAEGTAVIPSFMPAEWAAMPVEELVEYGEEHQFFTRWLSIDNSPTSGTGDFEGVDKLLSRNTQAQCNLWCPNPVLVQWRLEDRSDPDLVARIDYCLYLQPQKFGQMKSMTYPGFNCIDSRQNKGPCNATECADIGMRKDTKRSLLDCDYCPNFEVRYMCQETKNAVTSCPTSMASRDLDDELALLDAEIEARELEMAALQSRATIMEKKELREVESQVSTDKLQMLLREILATVENESP